MGADFTSGQTVTADILNDIFPPGCLLSYGGATAPAGFLLCYGQAVSRTTYARLFTAISTAWGVGDGSTTFNVPDFRGRSIVGKDDMGGSAASRVTTAGSAVDGATLGATGGAQNVTLTSAESGVGAHTHTVTDPGHTHQHGRLNQGGDLVPVGTGTAALTQTANATSQSATTGISLVSSSANASSPHTNMPPVAVANVIIKT